MTYVYQVTFVLDYPEGQISGSFEVHSSSGISWASTAAHDRLAQDFSAQYDTATKLAVTVTQKWTTY